MPDARPLQPGDPARLGSYEITGRLGEGGQGIVYLAHSAASDDPVAIKLLRADLAQDDTARTRFLRELEAAKRVARFCTAQVLEAEVDGDRPYIVSEYVPGPSLYQLVSTDSPRSGADLERLAIGTVTALVAIHQAGIVHRDFKPHNVLIGPDGPRVIDFGIAKALDGAATMTNSTIGTPAYMAPEQLSSQELTPAADIFAWASTMVFAATGQSPFGQDTVMAVIHRIINEPPDLGSMEEPLRSIVADCLVKDPAARPQTQLLLMRLLGEEGVTPAGPTAGDPPTAIMGQGAAFAGTVAGGAGVGRAPLTVPRDAGAATAAGGAASRGRSRAIVAVLAGLLVAAGVVGAFVWVAARGGDRAPAGTVQQTPAPSSQPATSEQPVRPIQPTRRREHSSAPTETSLPEPTTTEPTAEPSDGTTTTPPDGPTTPPDGPTTQPGGGPTTQPAGGASQPAGVPT